MTNSPTNKPAREIKFRAWSKKYKVMFNVGGLVNMDYRIDHQHRYATIGAPRHATMPDATPQVQEIELMQYTCLHDKNGKEIYEGDILEVYAGKKGEIVWQTLSASWMTAPYPSNPGQWPYSEVIGNIYTNPELLREPTQ